MSPYLLFGFFMAGLLSAFIPPEYVQKHLGGRGMKQVLKASLFGIPIPLCSCGVIPVITSLRKSGAGKGAVVSFLISTPQTGVDSFLATWSLLGPVFAFFRPIAAFISGVAGGVLIDIFCTEKDVPEKKDGEAFGCPIECCHEQITTGKGIQAEPQKKIWNRIQQIFKYGFVTLLGDIAIPLLAGIIIAALISMFLPDNWMLKVGSGFSGMILMMLFGIPLYVCATASVPIAAALMAKGVSAGAVFVFLMTGPATNAAAIAVLNKLLGKKTVILYLFSVILTAFFMGFIFNSLPIVSKNLNFVHSHHNMTLTLLGHTSAVLFSILILNSLRNRIK